MVDIDKLKGVANTMYKYLEVEDVAVLDESVSLVYAACDELEAARKVVEAAKFMVSHHAPQCDGLAEKYWGSAWLYLKDAIKELGGEK